jgi:integrase/recombinase XerD
MFETLYRYSRVLVRHRNGPAAEERDRFVTHCVRGGGRTFVGSAPGERTAARRAALGY